MPIIENRAERQFVFPLRKEPRKNETTGEVVPSTSTVQEALIIPMRGLRLVDGQRVDKPGRIVVTAEKLAEMQADRVAKHWFGHDGLVVVTDDAKPTPSGRTGGVPQKEART